MHLNGEIWLNGMKWGKYARNRKMDRIFMFVNIILTPIDCLPPGQNICIWSSIF